MCFGSIHALPLLSNVRYLKNGTTCLKKQRMTGSKPFGTCYKKFHYYPIYAIRNFELFALRYLLLHAQIIRIMNSEYSITTSFFGQYFVFSKPFVTLFLHFFYCRSV